MGTDLEFRKFVNDTVAIGITRKLANVMSFDANVSDLFRHLYQLIPFLCIVCEHVCGFVGGLH